jgi:hypothetical protein
MITLKIAGTKYYPVEQPPVGTVLALEADPENRFDSNAIKVLDDEGDQLGHVPAPAAAVMTLYAGRVGYPVGKLFIAKMEEGESFTLDMVDEL